MSFGFSKILLYKSSSTRSILFRYCSVAQSTKKEMPKNRNMEYSSGVFGAINLDSGGSGVLSGAGNAAENTHMIKISQTGRISCVSLLLNWNYEHLKTSAGVLDTIPSHREIRPLQRDIWRNTYATPIPIAITRATPHIWRNTYATLSVKYFCTVK